VFLKVSGCTKCCVLQDKTCPGWGSLPTRQMRNTFGWGRIMVGSVPQCSCRFRRRFAQLELQKLKDVSHESFVFTSSTFTLRDVSHESFVFPSSTFSFGGKLYHLYVYYLFKKIFTQHGKWPECRWFTKFNMVTFKLSIANCSLNCQRANPRFMVLSIGEWWFTSQTCNCVFI
jgi:hypothetical protein